MKHLILTAALASIFCVSHAQNRQRDSSIAMPHGTPNRTDSVINGQEVITGKGSQQDTLFKKRTSKKTNNSSKSHQTGQKEMTAPNQKTSSQKTSTVGTKP